ncbi:MAG: class I mannose-6-phosphate isomerase [Erythrobacter sp.]
MSALQSTPGGDAFVRKLTTRMVEKVWGRDSLPAPFAAPPGKRIGEIWFEPPAELEQLLVKYLFTSEKLSVQVHPSVQNAQGTEAGKEECWLVLDADPGAQLAIGFDRAVSTQEVEQAANDGSIEQLLTWHDAHPGDVFYLPAGTVHAIGPGLSLVEVQQNSDTTFRLYDYGRPRELHLERALDVADCGPYARENRSAVKGGSEVLVAREHFRIDRIEGASNYGSIMAGNSPSNGPLLLLPLSGQIRWGEHESAAAGECVIASALDLVNFTQADVTLVIAPA